MVEEFMILANHLAANLITKCAKRSAILRVHPDYSNASKDKLSDFFDANGIDCDVSSNKAISDSLMNLSTLPDKTKHHVAIRQLYCNMKKSLFVCVNELDPSSWKQHFMNLDAYTLFTSPIRRYPDMLAHRMLITCLEYGDKAEYMLKHIDYEELMEECNEKRAAIKKASQECHKLFLCLLIKGKGTIDTEGIVTDISSTAVKFYIPSLDYSFQLVMSSHDEVKKFKYIPFRKEMIAIYDTSAYTNTDKNLPNVENEEDYNQLIKKIKADPVLNQRFLHLKVLDKKRIVISINDRIPVDIICRVKL